jgi:hypothetical protein
MIFSILADILAVLALVGVTDEVERMNKDKKACTWRNLGLRG